MSGAEGFGPSGPGAAESPPFSVAGPSQIQLDPTRRGPASFTVSNVTGRPVRARLFVLPGANTDAAWFAIAPEGVAAAPVGGQTAAERSLPVAGTATVEVTVSVPPDAPAGTASFTLGAALEEAPDRLTASPTVTFEIPPAEKRKFPWWIVIVAVVAILVLAGGGLLIWELLRDRSTPSESPTPTDAMPTPTPSPTPSVHTQMSDTVSMRDSILDLESGAVWELTNGKFIPGGDVWFYDSNAVFEGGAGSSELLLSSFNSSIAIVPDAELETCRAAMAPGADGQTPPTYTTIVDLAVPQHVCLITGERHYAVFTVAPQVTGVPDRQIDWIVWAEAE
uniref:Uncharacterized protein n=1 Tax=termite gut metagenome TaxID=433724 RepID=S0DE06_9ZZZZ